MRGRSDIQGPVAAGYTLEILAKSRVRRTAKLSCQAYQTIKCHVEHLQGSGNITRISHVTVMGLHMISWIVWDAVRCQRADYISWITSPLSKGSIRHSETSIGNYLLSVYHPRCVSIICNKCASIQIQSFNTQLFITVTVNSYL